MAKQKTYTGSSVDGAVKNAAKGEGVAPEDLKYEVLAGRQGGFALIRITDGSAAALGKERLTGKPSADGGDDDGGERHSRGRDRDRDRDRGGRGRDRDRDRGRGRGRRDRDRGGRDRDRDRGGRDRRGRGRRGGDYPVLSIPTDGPTDVVMRVAEGVELTEIGEDAHEVVRDILTGMGFGMAVDVVETEEVIRFDLESGVYHEGLTAHDNMLLDALEHLVDKIVNFDAEARKKLIIDSQGVKKAMDEDLGRSAVDLANRALEEGRTMKIGPLDARSRRLVHIALREFDGVTTRSEGEGAFRRVCIIPKS